MNEKNNQNAPILGVSGGEGEVIVPASNFPSGTYKIKFSDEYYQGSRYSDEKQIKGRIMLIQNDDTNDGNYFVIGHEIYDDAFIDEYVDFLKTYSETDDTTALLTEYLEYMTRYTEVMGKLDDIDESKLSEADSLYYSEVMLRISQKMLEAEKYL